MSQHQAKRRRHGGLPDGSTRVSKNGYHYTKQEGIWRLTHHIIAEETLGRELTRDDSVRFIDNDRTNLVASNIQVRPKGTRTRSAERARILARIDEYKARLHELDELDKLDGRK